MKYKKIMGYCDTAANTACGKCDQSSKIVVPLNHGPITDHPDIAVGSGNEHRSNQKQIS